MSSVRSITSLFALVLTFSVSAQVLEVPTLKSKSIEGQVTTIEWHTFQFAANEGLTYVKKDVETYNAEGVLVSIYTDDLNSKQQYKTVYTLDKKGLLEQMQIVNPTNNLALQTTTYDYKKGLLQSTTQTQGPNTVVKNYTYDKKDRLIEVEVSQNGTVRLNEYYELDDKDRRTKISRKVPGQDAISVASTFTYEEKEGKLITVEKRNTDQGEFEITKVTDLSSNRDLTESSKKISTNQQGEQRQVFVDDASGNWIKAEVIDDQGGRSRLVLRKITYANGETTGRDMLVSEEDDRGQFLRKGYQKQMAVNGKIVNSGTAYILTGSKDRLTFVGATSSWYLMKGYDDNTNMTKWAEADLIAKGLDKVVYAARKDGVDVYYQGKKLSEGSTTYSGYTEYRVANSSAVYVRDNVNQTFIAEATDVNEGKVFQAELTKDHYNWGKASDSTYILTAFGRSVPLEKQLEDEAGNKLAYRQVGSMDYWYFLPEFRKKFSEEAAGSMHPARFVQKPSDVLSDGGFQADFSRFSYTKLADRRYRLISADGLVATSIAAKSVKTPDDELLAYFPLTEQYLRMDDYYRLEDGKEWPGKSVTVMLDSSAYAYYIYNDGGSIIFYEPGARMDHYKFDAHKLNPNGRTYGALLYDSIANTSYGMTYDLEGDKKMGAMKKLPLNTAGAYLLKLEGGRWVIFEKGYKVDDYDFSKLRNDNEVVHFYKNAKGGLSAYSFPNFDQAKAGDFIYANNLQDNEIRSLLTELKVDPNLTPEDDPRKDRQPGTYDKEDDLFYVRDASGRFIQNDFAWFSQLGEGGNMVAYDSVAHITYELTGYYNQKEIIEGTMKVLVGNEGYGLLKWEKNKLLLAINGQYQGDISRAYITQDASDEIWKELAYDASSDLSFKVSYPSDSSFHVSTPELLPANDADTYLFRINEKEFIVITKGKLLRDSAAKSYPYQGDLIRLFKEGDTTKAYRFRGYDKAAAYELLGAEVIPATEIPALVSEISKSGN